MERGGGFQREWRILREEEVGNKHRVCRRQWEGIKRYTKRVREREREKEKIECPPPLSLTLKLRAVLDSGGMLKYTVLSFPPSSLSIARNTCTT